MVRVVVTGLGVVSALGHGKEAFEKALLSGASAAREVERFDTSKLDRHIACEITEFRARDFLTAAEARRAARCSQFALAAARMAVEDAAIADQIGGPRTSVIIGTTMGEANVLGALEAQRAREGHDSVPPSTIPRYGTALLPIHIARAFGAQGMVQALPAACAAGNYAIGYALDLIRSGRADVVITGGAEVLEKLQFEGFARLGAMTPDRVRPFNQERKGILIGEGAGIMVLESEVHAKKRGANILVEVGGYGIACDAFHITRPHPEGEGSAQAMHDAIATSGIKPSDVSLINAHGTATPANDVVESHVIRRIFGAQRVPVTSVKSMLGHCMGAASALEAISCVQSILSNKAPPTINFETLDPECDVDVIANQARDLKCDVVLNNSLAFGGYNAVVCFARPGHLPEPKQVRA